jgi:hypothetical protein
MLIEIFVFALCASKRNNKRQTSRSWQPSITSFLNSGFHLADTTATIYEMNFALIISLLVTMFVGCKEHSTNATVKEVKTDATDLAKPLIRYISINSIGERFGIKLNGDQAFFRLETEVPERKKNPYCDGLRLLEGFTTFPELKHIVVKVPMTARHQCSIL